jgi:hypothetical protein
MGLHQHHALFEHLGDLVDVELLAVVPHPPLMTVVDFAEQVEVELQRSTWTAHPA